LYQMFAQMPADKAVGTDDEDFHFIHLSA
jgi:hypothetical protein